MGTRNVLRRDFLSMLATGAAAAGIGTLASPAQSLAGAASLPQSPGASDFDAWLGKIKGATSRSAGSPSVTKVQTANTNTTNSALKGSALR